MARNIQDAAKVALQLGRQFRAFLEVMDAVQEGEALEQKLQNNDAILKGTLDKIAAAQADLEDLRVEVAREKDAEKGRRARAAAEINTLKRVAETEAQAVVDAANAEARRIEREAADAAKAQEARAKKAAEDAKIAEAELAALVSERDKVAKAIADLKASIGVGV